MSFGVALLKQKPLLGGFRVSGSLGLSVRIVR